MVSKPAAIAKIPLAQLQLLFYEITVTAPASIQSILFMPVNSDHHGREQVDGKHNKVVKRSQPSKKEELKLFKNLYCNLREK
jgi:hypothetical protein